MSLNMYLGEVQAQTQSMNAMCNATIQGMEQVINSIDTFVFDAVLQGQTYDSAKAFFAQTFRPLAQGIIYLCEKLIRQNNAFPNDFQSQVATTDVIEEEIKEQIRGIERTKAGIEAISSTLPGMQVMGEIFDAMKRKLQEKLDHLHRFDYTSSSNYDTALQLAASIAQGLAEVQSGKGYSSASGTFSTQELNMDWIAPIQKITDDKAREADNSIKEGATCGKLTPKSDLEAAWDEFKTDVGDVLQGAGEFLQGASGAVVENLFGLEPPDNDKLESKITYQAGRFGGNVLTGIVSIAEIYGAISFIGGVNFLTLVAEAGTFGAATPIVVPLDLAATAAAAGVGAHGGYVWYKTIQNGKDSLQKIQSSGDGVARTSADDIRKVPDDILDQMENAKGHLLQKHVGKTNDDLLKRAAQEGVDATTFTDKSTATKAVQANIRRNADDISNWLNDPNSSGIKTITTDHGYSIGKGVEVKNGGSSASKQVAYDLTKSKVVLVKDSSMPNGYKIVTGYPTIN